MAQPLLEDVAQHAKQRKKHRHDNFVDGAAQAVAGLLPLARKAADGKINELGEVFIVDSTCPKAPGERCYGPSESTLRRIPPEDLSGFTKIYLANNKIAEVKYDSLVGLSNCKYLELSSNRIHTIEAGSFEGLGNNNTETELYLDNNQLTELNAGMWEGIFSLQVLSIGKHMQLPAIAFLQSLNHLFAVFHLKCLFRGKCRNSWPEGEHFLNPG